MRSLHVQNKLGDWQKHRVRLFFFSKMSLKVLATFSEHLQLNDEFKQIFFQFICLLEAFGIVLTYN